MSPKHFPVLSIAIFSTSTNEDLALVEQRAVFHSNTLGDKSKLFGIYSFPDDILKLLFNEQQKFPTHLRLTDTNSNHCPQLWGTGDVCLTLIFKCVHSASSF